MGSKKPYRQKGMGQQEGEGEGSEHGEMSAALFTSSFRPASGLTLCSDAFRNHHGECSVQSP